MNKTWKLWGENEMSHHPNIKYNLKTILSLRILFK